MPSTALQYTGTDDSAPQAYRSHSPWRTGAPDAAAAAQVLRIGGHLHLRQRPTPPVPKCLMANELPGPKINFTKMFVVQVHLPVATSCCSL